jgi:uncharacterized membrane protein YqhA
LTLLAFRRWLMVPVVAGCSIALALFIPGSLNETLWIGMPGFIYFTLNFASVYFAIAERRLIATAVEPL